MLLDKIVNFDFAEREPVTLRIILGTRILGTNSDQKYQSQSFRGIISL